ncbi:hypothetical protein BLA29_001957 [Euroglyphus maynei]|uniref:Uncharacterized protein n=1 Tax=Euroglyphus maynei TaxID=6958 RepID=A0A1Y3BP71_EURMA|nr:hypothetical protein BLA29_001957 [Euroglyphus maynei]
MSSSDNDQQSSNILTLQDKFFDSILNVEQSLFPSWQQQMLEATWKLNEWDLSLNCDSQLNNNHLNNSSIQNHRTHGTGGIGEILFAMHKQESPFLIDSKLSDVRQNFQIHLNAALLTNSFIAYNRTYDRSILQLHIIHDIQQFVTVIYNRLLMIDDDNQQSNYSHENNQSVEQLQNNFHEILTEWRNRNQLINEGQQRQQIIDVQRALIQLFLRFENKIGQQMCCNLREELFRFQHDSLRCSLQSGRLDRAAISLADIFKIRDELSQRSSWKISDNESVDFLLDHAQVLWNQNQRTKSIELLKTELQKRYHTIQHQCYLESLKNITPMPQQDLYKLSNMLDLNLTGTQINQMSGSGNVLLSSFTNGENRGGGMRASARSRNHDETVQISHTEENLLNYGRIQLQIAKYSEYGGRLDSDALMILYKSVTISCPQWEEAHFHLAMFYRRLYRQYQNVNPLLDSKTTFLVGKTNEILDLKVRTIKSICDSLRFGTYKFVRLSLPILLNIWFHMGYEKIQYQNRLRTTQDQRFL